MVEKNTYEWWEYSLALLEKNNDSMLSREMNFIAREINEHE